MPKKQTVGQLQRPGQKRVPHCIWCKGVNIVLAFRAAIVEAGWGGSVKDTYRCLDCLAAGRASLSTPIWDEHFHDVPSTGRGGRRGKKAG